jgi:hypothetical protein
MLKRSRFTQEQIIGVKEHEAGATSPDLCREHRLNNKKLFRLYRAERLGVRWRCGRKREHSARVC